MTKRISMYTTAVTSLGQYMSISALPLADVLLAADKSIAKKKASPLLRPVLHFNLLRNVKDLHSQESGAVICPGFSLPAILSSTYLSSAPFFFSYSAPSLITTKLQLQSRNPGKLGNKSACLLLTKVQIVLQRLSRTSSRKFISKDLTTNFSVSLF